MAQPNQTDAIKVTISTNTTNRNKKTVEMSPQKRTTQKTDCKTLQNADTTKPTPKTKNTTTTTNNNTKL